MNEHSKTEPIILLPVYTRVFDIPTQRWGTILEIKDFKDYDYPYTVYFRNNGVCVHDHDEYDELCCDTETYTLEGRRLEKYEIPSLSLTEFNYLTNTGFFTSILDFHLLEPSLNSSVFAYNFENTSEVYFGEYLENKKEKYSVRIGEKVKVFDVISKLDPRLLKT